MENIRVRILSDNLYENFPRFLARLTQRGHEINSILNVEELFEENVTEGISEYFLNCNHSTLRRMNYMTVAIEGLSTKCVSQLRTHAKRLTFISTSTQYSDFSKRETSNFVIPDGLTEEQKELFKEVYQKNQLAYEYLMSKGIDKDKASYVLGQGLRKALIVSGNLDDWQYVMKTRLCHRNSDETQYVMKLILKELRDRMDDEDMVRSMYPRCWKGECIEGKFCCGRQFNEEEIGYGNS